MRNIHVRYGLSPRADAELRFGIDLARRLRARLFVWTEADAASDALLKAAGCDDAATREQAHVRDRVSLLVARMEAGLQPTYCQGNPTDAVRDRESIVIGGRDAGGRQASAALATMGERALGARGAGEIFLPFANGASAETAAKTAIPLAARLGAPVLFYHTTWREEGVPDDAPAERHMTDEAFEVQERLWNLADRAGVRHRSVIETATAIAEGTVRGALNEGCALIAMARGRHVGAGSYVDQVLERSVIPVLVAGRSAS